MSTESEACTPISVENRLFNPRAQLPYGLSIAAIESAMNGFTDFLEVINTQLHSKGLPRLEKIMMSANFSSLVGEFMCANIPSHCPSLARNRYHNGHPDMVPTGRFNDNAIQFSDEGIEIKASRYLRGWQGHNPEDVFLMVFVFDASTPRDEFISKPPIPFSFREVLAARVTKADWTFSGRGAGSRRTITASINGTGLEKLQANWVYRVPDEAASTPGRTNRGRKSQG